MKAKVKDFWIYNAASALEEYRPENEDCFVLYLNITVSPLLDDGCGTCDFQLAICNPEWVRRQCDIHGAIWGRHMMVVPSYDLDMIKNKIRAYVNDCEAENFTEVSRLIARIACWEYEDYSAN